VLQGVGISEVVTSPAGVVIRYAARLIFANNENSTNNTTEYEALLLALRKMKALGQQTFTIRTDSKVIQEHVEKESETRNPVLMKYMEKVREMERHFKGDSVYHPQSNGAVERANGLIFSRIKKCLFDQKKGKWVDELLKVICFPRPTTSVGTRTDYSVGPWDYPTCAARYLMA
jgi:ribonuclease HI